MVFTGCGPGSQYGDISRRDLEKQMEDIKEYIAATSCLDAASCKYIAYGAKSCGGPAGYLYFSNGVNEEKLNNLVEAYTLAERKYNVANDVLSDCTGVLPSETIKCRSGKCVPLK